jgi:transmembrane sensor
MIVDDRTREEAAEWFAVLRRGPMSVEERTAFDAWRADPDNQRALDRMHELWGELSALDQPALGLRQPARPRRLAAIAAASALIVAGSLAVGFLLVQPRAAGAQIETRRGEQRTKTLPDGSVVALNVVTRLGYRIQPQRRAASLSEGEAAFFVRSDPHRPFVVQAGEYEISSSGGAFDVLNRDGTIEVAVSQGVVEVRSLASERWRLSLATLSSGQRLKLSAGAASRTAAVTSVPVQSVADWRSRTP